jgi:hypothetical protein
MRHYAQLPQEKRYQIYAFMNAGFTQKVIAGKSGRIPPRSTGKFEGIVGKGGCRPAHRKSLLPVRYKPHH